MMSIFQAAVSGCGVPDVNHIRPHKFLVVVIWERGKALASEIQGFRALFDDYGAALNSWPCFNLGRPLRYEKPSQSDADEAEKICSLTSRQISTEAERLGRDRQYCLQAMLVRCFCFVVGG